MRFGWLTACIVAIAACGPTAPPTYQGFATNACDALAALDRTVRSGHRAAELTRTLDEAVRGANVERADELASVIVAELERGRQSAAAAAAWQPGATAMAHLDHVLVAHEAVVAAKVRRAARDPAANPDAIFRAAGGTVAYDAMLREFEAVQRARPPDVPPFQCEGASIP